VATTAPTRSATGGSPRSRTTTAASAAGHAESRTKLVLYGLAAVLAVLVFAAPLLWSLLRAFQTNAVITEAPSWSTFFDLTAANFAAVGGTAGLGRATLNSLVVSLSTAVLTAAVATAAGYGFGRFRFRFSGVAFGAVVLTLMIPFQAIITPLFMQLNAMRLTDSLLGLVLFYTTVNLPFGVFVMRNAFASVPSELEDAAFVDGAGTGRTFFSVLRPLVTPGIATTALYAFLASWTEFLGALTFLTQQQLYTLPVALLNLQQGAYGAVDYGLLAAGALIAMIPCVVLYVALQRYYVAGLASGSLKG
jgi:multiple sugar transport system permease protein